jgi:hypothetical protein
MASLSRLWHAATPACGLMSIPNVTATINKINDEISGYTRDKIDGEPRSQI